MKINSFIVFLCVMTLAHVLSEQAGIFFDFSQKYIVVVSLTLSAFSIGYLICSRNSMSRYWIVNFPRLLEKKYIGPYKAKRYFILLFLLFSFLTVLNRIIIYGPSFWEPDTVMLYRNQIIMEGLTNPIKGLSIGNFFIFLFPSFALCYWRQFTVIGRVILFAIFFMDVYLSSSRSALFLPVLIGFFFWAIPRKVNFSFLMWMGTIALCLIFGFNLMGEVVGKATDELGVLVYVAAPLHAFDVILNDSSELKGIWLSFSPLQSIFGSASIELLPNIMTPLPTNVYTIFGVYYVDYGIFGLFFSFFLIGCFSAILEKSYRITKSNSQRVYVALNMSILTLSVFYDYYTTSGVIWMTVLLTPFFFGPLRFANENSAPVALKLGYQNCTS